MKKPTTAQATEMIRKAVDEGRVAFASPEAEACFPITKRISDCWEQEFHYLETTAIKPAKYKDEARKQYSHDGGIHFQWGLKGIGFGEASVVLRGGKWAADTERLGRKFIEKLLSAWAKKMVIR